MRCCCHPALTLGMLIQVEYEEWYDFQIVTMYHVYPIENHTIPCCIDNLGVHAACVCVYLKAPDPVSEGNHLLNLI